MRKQITRTELRELFKEEPAVLTALENVWEKQSTARYFPKVRNFTREELKDAFKDKPIILNALLDTWHPKAKCEYCSCEYRKKQNNQKFCSVSCRDKHSRRTPKGIARQKRAYESRQRQKVGKQSFKCGMCGKEYLAYPKTIRRTCSKKCKDDYDEYMDRVLKWD
jgi:hypothetical protein